MEFFRSHTFRKVFTLVVGIVFINLCFILSEVNALKKYRVNKVLVENIEKIISINTLEEESDSASTLVGADQFLDLLHHQHSASLSCTTSDLKNQFNLRHSSHILSLILDVAIQPPEEAHLTRA